MVPESEGLRPKGRSESWGTGLPPVLLTRSPGPERVPETVYLEKIKKIFIFSENFRNIFGWGALPSRPPNFWLGGQSPPRPPLNGRSSHLIEAAKRGRLDQMIFFSAPLTTRAPPTTVRRPSDDRPPAVRQPSTVPMILRYLGANLRAGANFKNLPLKFT